jgi:hypothetical protein
MKVVDAKNHIGEALNLFEQKLDEKNALQVTILRQLINSSI